jgi:hypothetical protein
LYLSFGWDVFNDVAIIDIKDGTDFIQNGHTDFFVLTHLGHSVWGKTSELSQVAFAHITLDEQTPKRFV